MIPTSPIIIGPNSSRSSRGILDQGSILDCRLASPWSVTSLATTTQVFVPSRSFSSLPLRRPPPRQEDSETTSRTFKLRTHAVSLNIGDYSDPMAGSASSWSYVDPNDRRSTEDKEDVSTKQDMGKNDELKLAESIRQEQEEEDQRKRRWLETAKPPIRHPIIDERGRAYGRGGRKTASARVWIQPGMGHVVVNRLDFVDYFERFSDRELILSPLAATETLGKFDVTAFVQGGGLRGQAGAVRHGLARALNAYNPDAYRPPLKRLGYLTRDPRQVERKKIGHIKARKKPQWVKR